LQGFDFWGFCDIDVVYGQLRQHFTPERLARYDLLSTMARRTAGPLTLIRNTEEMREVFRLMPDWERRCASEKHQRMEESAFSHIFMRHRSWPMFLRKLTNPWFRRADFTETYATPNTDTIAWRDGTFSFPDRWLWKNGVISNDKDGAHEFPYFHFYIWKYGWKKGVSEQCPDDAKEWIAQGAWQITESGFSALEDLS
jgi:hypothetical protein